MRPIHLARLDKSRPVLVLTREVVRPHLNTVTIAPLTTTIRGLSSEVLCGTANGLDDRCAVTCDHIITIPTDRLGRQIGRLLDEQELELTSAIHAAFDLDAILP
jgi:mRNA interferase MazF